MKLKSTMIVCGVFCAGLQVQAQTAKWNEPGCGNPIIPGYFADPTIKKFGDTYYIYATTDGNGGGFGPSQVWQSKDLKNWSIMPMNWPTTHWIWAPDVMKHTDGKYYMYYCQPCQLHCGVSETPRGPWTNILGKDDAVLVPDRFVTNAITLDGQTFVDDDGSVYIYFGTWGIYKGFGCGVAKFAPDMKSFVEKRLIPNTEATDFFEAPFVLKRNGIYYFMYSSGSCHDHTYRVQYATSTVGPMGPYTYGKNNPILETNADGTVHGPGHHSVLQEGDNYYILYHQHDNPHSTRGMHRQLCLDKLEFDDEGNMLKVVPTHEGVSVLKDVKDKYPDLAFGKPVKASSYYNDTFSPKYAVDDNNATLWRPRTVGEEWIQVDLQEKKHIEQVMTQFEYATSYYQYVVEVSDDAQHWTIFSDKSQNRLAGSPMMDYGKADARYVRVRFLNCEQNGLSGAIWNLRVYSGMNQIPPQQMVGLRADDFKSGKWTNVDGMMGGHFEATADVVRTNLQQRDAVVLPKGASLTSSFELPSTSQPFTLSYKVFSAEPSNLTCSMLGKAVKMMPKQWNNQWHSVAWVSDGKRVTCYVDGEAVKTSSTPKMKQNKVVFTAATDKCALTDVRLYNWAQEKAEVAFDAATPLKSAAQVDNRNRKGLVFDLSAQPLTIGQQYTTVACADGSQQFATDAPVGVVLKQGRKAFDFTGTQRLDSKFPLPYTLQGNAPYTLSAWVFNPTVQANECIANLVPTHAENGTVTLGNGSNEANGVVSHCGSFEDMSLPVCKEKAGEWQHWTLVFDGYKEYIYLNGALQKSKDLVLLLQPSDHVSVGMNYNGEWPFTGYIQRVKLWDTPLSEQQVRAEAADTQLSSSYFDFNAADGVLSNWQNEGAWCGTTKVMPAEKVVNGHLAITEPLKVEAMKTNGIANELTVWMEALKALPARPVTVAALDACQLGVAKDGWYVNGKKVATDVLRVGAGHLVSLQNRQGKLQLFVDGVKKADVDGDASCFKTSSVSLLPNTKGAVALRMAVLSADTFSAQTMNEWVSSMNKTAATLSVTSEMRYLTPWLVSASCGVSGAESGLLKYRYVSGTKDSGWLNDANFLLPLEAGMNTCKVQVKDNLGNIRYQKMETLRQPKQWTVGMSQPFKGGKQVDAQGKALVDATEFDGVILTGAADNSTIAKAEKGVITLGSKDRNFQDDAAKNGVLLYKNMKGDFTIQARVCDFMGRNKHQSPGFNEGGVMVLCDDNANRQKAIHVGVFPHYRQGNILTYLNGFRRQSSNNKDWDFDDYMQIEKNGETFYIRTSKDGKQWTEIPGSPIVSPALANKTLKVGIYQVTYSENYGEFSFDKVQIYQR